jgi:hypothetical protein
MLTSGVTVSIATVNVALKGLQAGRQPEAALKLLSWMRQVCYMFDLLHFRVLLQYPEARSPAV